jgi:hypothetical protein
MRRLSFSLKVIGVTSSRRTPSLQLMHALFRSRHCLYFFSVFPSQASARDLVPSLLEVFFALVPDNNNYQMVCSSKTYSSTTLAAKFRSPAPGAARESSIPTHRRTYRRHPRGCTCAQLHTSARHARSRRRGYKGFSR